MREVAVAGVGMHKFGRFGDKPLREIGLEAAVNALKDANLKWKDVQAAYCSTLGSAGHGIFILNQLGRTSIPVCDSTGGGASGGIALRNAYVAVASGVYDVAICLGFEKMPRGFVTSKGNDGDYMLWQQALGLCQNPMYWAMRAKRHMFDYGTTVEQLARVSVKSHKNASMNPYAMHQRPMTLEEVLNSPLVCDPIRLFAVTSPNEGAAAAVLVSMDVAKRLSSRPITVSAVAQRTNHPNWMWLPYYSFSSRDIPNPAPTPLAAKQAYEESGIGPEDVDVAEVQDTDAFNEIMHCEELGLCKMGEGGRLIDEGATELGGRIPVNTGGGILSCGEPFGATHLRQVTELVWQLRGVAGPRQVPGAKVGLAHSAGGGGHCVVTILKR